MRARVRPSGPRPKSTRRPGEKSERPRSSEGRSDRPRAERRPQSEGRREKENGASRSANAASGRAERESDKRRRVWPKECRWPNKEPLRRSSSSDSLTSMAIQAEVSVQGARRGDGRTVGERRSADGVGRARGSAGHHAAGPAGGDAHRSAVEEPEPNRPHPGRRCPVSGASGSGAWEICPTR